MMKDPETDNSPAEWTNPRRSDLQLRRIRVSFWGAFLAGLFAFFTVFGVLTCKFRLGMGPLSRFTTQEPFFAGLNVGFLCFILVLTALVIVSRIHLIYQSVDRAAICIGFGIIIGSAAAMIGSASVDETSPLDDRVLSWNTEDTYFREGHLIKLRVVTWLVGAECGSIAAISMSRLLYYRDAD